MVKVFEKLDRRRALHMTSIAIVRRRGKDSTLPCEASETVSSGQCPAARVRQGRVLPSNRSVPPPRPQHNLFLTSCCIEQRSRKMRRGSMHRSPYARWQNDRQYSYKTVNGQMIECFSSHAAAGRGGNDR